MTGVSLFSDPITELSAFGPAWVVIGLVAAGYVVLIKKLLDAKNEQVQAAKEENTRNETTVDALLRASDSILTLLDSKNDAA